METDNIMEQILRVDFKAPVQIKVIFEDSDDDNTSDLPEIKQEPDDNNTVESKTAAADLNTHVPLPVINANTRLSAENVDKGIKQEPMMDPEIAVQKQLSVPLVVVEKENQLSLEQKKTDNIAIKTEGCEQNNTQVIVLDEYEPSIVKNEKLLSVDIDSTKIKHVIENGNDRKRQLEKDSSKSESSKRQFDGNDILKTNTQVDDSAKPVPTNTFNSTINPTQNNNDADVLGGYISNLLTSISKYLLYVLDAYCLYLAAKHYSIDVNKYKDSFVQARLHFFNLSFSTVSNIILPQEHNSSFIKCFIEDTMKLGFNMERRYNSEVHIKPLLLDLISWTKRKQSYVTTSTNNVTDSPKLRNQLSSPPKAFTNTTLTNNFKNSKPRYTRQNKPVADSVHKQAQSQAIKEVSTEQVRQENILFTSGPPGQEISISIAPSTLQSHQRSAIHPISQTPVNNYIDRSDDKKVHRETLRTNISQPVYQYQNNNNLNSMLQNYVPNQTVQRNSPNSTVISSPQQTSNTYWQNPTWELPQNHANIKANAGPAAVSPQMNEQLNTEAIRSVSTDSGFGSPLHFNNYNDIMDKEYIEKNRTVQPSAPVISHVTSMNPAATLNMTGSCYVCGMVTKQMCIGCYKRYYCSNNCQRADWYYHQYTCRS